MVFALRRNQTAADIDGLRARIERDVHKHRGWYIFQGAVFLIFGALAILLPGVTALSAEIFIGALLLVTGLFQLVASVRSRMHWWAFFSALLSIIIGGWMLWMPVAGLLALAMMVTIFLAVEGAIEILLAFEFRPMRNWGWMLVSGIASLILAMLLWSGFPILSAFLLGLLIGVNFIFYGLSVLILAGIIA